MRIILAGGGTLGSVTPLIAIAETIKEKNSHIEFLWVGTKKGPEAALVQQAGIQFATLPVAKFRRYYSIKNITDSALMVLALIKSLLLIIRFNPDCVICAGSFAQVPIIYAARIISPKTRIIIHQQDIQKGLANRLCERFARKITVATKKSLSDFSPEKTVYTGNPYRFEIMKGSVSDGYSVFHLEKNMPTVLILGGSAGAQALNNLVIEAIPALTKFSQILHITGKNKTLTKNAHFHRYRAYPFMTAEISHAYAISDIVVSRAGFSTITELSILAKPSIIIPIPDSHQEANAHWLKTNNAAVVLPQKTLTTASFIKHIQSLLQNKEERFALSSAISTLLPKDANERFLQEIFDMFEKGLEIKKW